MKIPLDSRIAITGATGFLGSHILRALFEKGYTNIAGLKRSTSNLDLISDVYEKTEWIEGDILDIESLNALISNADYVIHSAAKVSYNPKDRKEVYQVNVEGTANIVNVCLSQNPKKLIFLSSVAAIGRIKSGITIDEHSEWSDSEFNTNYAISKYMAELEVWRGMSEGQDMMIINPSMILGPSKWGDSSTKLFTHVFKGSKLHPSGANGFVDVRDVAKLTLAAMESDEINNERVIAVSEAMTYKDIFGLIAKKAKMRAPSLEISPFLGGLAWRIFALKRLLFGGDPPITSETVKITSGNFIYDNSKSIKLFNYKYLSIEEAVSDTVEAYNESKLKKNNFSFFSSIYS